MKKLKIGPLIPLLLAGTLAMAQGPAPQPDTISNPVKEGDPAIKALPPRLDYVEDKKQITMEELPAPVQHTLQNDSKYRGWEKATIFHEENKDEYIVEFRAADNATTYRFNKAGTQIIEE